MPAVGADPGALDLRLGFPVVSVFVGEDRDEVAFAFAGVIDVEVVLARFGVLAGGVLFASGVRAEPGYVVDDGAVVTGAEDSLYRTGCGAFDRQVGEPCGFR